MIMKRYTKNYVYNLRLGQMVQVYRPFLGQIQEGRVISINCDSKVQSDLRVEFGPNERRNIKAEDLVRTPQTRKELYQLMKKEVKNAGDAIEFLRKCRDSGLIDIKLPRY